MTYLITGATSFLGTELTKALIDHGHRVTAICRLNSCGLQNLPKDVSMVYAEMHEYKDLPKQINHADVFIHLAWAGTGHDGRDITEIQKQNIAYTIDAMRAAHQIGCRLFVMAGSQAEYGSTSEPQREDIECAPFSEYGKAKLQVQQDCSRLADELGLKYIHLRIFSLIGEKDHPWTLVMSCVDKMKRDEAIDLSACTQNWNFLYVSDAVEQIRRLCDYALSDANFKYEIYNIASADTRMLREFVERMKELTESQSELRYGAIVPERIVSLQPDMSKTAESIGEPITRYGFDEVIEMIMKKK